MDDSRGSTLRFNSRTREGCDSTNVGRVASIVGFNSRTREGCDPFTPREVSIERRFNSRTREGCDFDNQFLRGFFLQFQFTHPGGVRPV